MFKITDTYGQFYVIGAMAFIVPLGTVAYTPFLSSIVEIKQQTSDTVFVSDFEGNACTVL